MCHAPTEEEIARSKAEKAAAAPVRQERHDPWTYPEPRGNQEPDHREVEKGRERLATVLGH